VIERKRERRPRAFLGIGERVRKVVAVLVFVPTTRNPMFIAFQREREKEKKYMKKTATSFGFF
jgi:hypothetical protein